ncbi:sensor histidine kinase [Methanooceanicella nereidis]|nr:ATP-binding protein [Methanocella sp. CWC-04]
MDSQNDRQKLMDNALMGLEIGISAMIAILFLISPITEEVFAAASILIVLFCIIVSFKLFISNRDRDLKNMIKGLMSSLTIWMVVILIEVFFTSHFNIQYLMPVSEILMLAGYLPLIYYVHRLLIDNRDRFDGRLDRKIIPGYLFLILVILYYASSNIIPVKISYFDTLLLISYLIAGIIFLALSTKALLGRLEYRIKYFLVILTVFIFLNFLGDALNLIEVLRAVDTGGLPATFYSLGILYLTLSLLVFSFNNRNTSLIDDMSKKLNDTQRFTRDLMSQSPDAVSIFNNDGSMVSVNDSFLRIYNVTRHEVEGKYNLFTDWKALGLSSGSQAESLKKGNILALERCKPGIGKFKGGDFYSSLKIFPTYDSDGRMSGYVGISMDLSNNVGLESDIRCAHDKLRDEYERKLEFTGIAAQELKAPLTPILGCLDRVRSEIKDESQRQYLDIIERNAYRQKNIIDRMVELSRLDNGKISVRYDDVDPCGLANAILGNYSTYKRTTVNEIPSGTIIRTDKEKLHNILDNMISNAMKYSYDGSKVSIGLYEQGPEYIFSVSDTGRGIHPSDLERIFERFYIVDANNDKRECGRIGLGLALVKGYVQLLGGRVWLESTPGEGSTFYFSIPKHNDF